MRREVVDDSKSPTRQKKKKISRRPSPAQQEDLPSHTRLAPPYLGSELISDPRQDKNLLEVRSVLRIFEHERQETDFWENQGAGLSREQK